MVATIEAIDRFREFAVGEVRASDEPVSLEDLWSRWRSEAVEAVADRVVAATRFDARGEAPLDDVLHAVRREVGRPT